MRRAAPEAQGLGADAQAVVFRLRPVRAGESVRIRIAETYTDPTSYRLDGDGSLVWRRTLGRPLNAVVLPPGWMLVSSSIPATVAETGDGRVRLDYVNPRPDELDVRIVARRRAG